MGQSGKKRYDGDNKYQGGNILDELKAELSMSDREKNRENDIEEYELKIKNLKLEKQLT